jgi:hypothetical protein
MLIDANLLLYAVQERAEQHATAADWLTEQQTGHAVSALRGRPCPARPWRIPHDADVASCCRLAARIPTRPFLTSAGGRRVRQPVGDRRT